MLMFVSSGSADFVLAVYAFFNPHLMQVPPLWEQLVEKILKMRGKRSRNRLSLGTPGLSPMSLDDSWGRGNLAVLALLPSQGSERWLETNGFRSGIGLGEPWVKLRICECWMG